MKTIKEYIENEEFELERLEDRSNKVKNKWFKNSGAKLEIEFLNLYINLKRKLIQKLK